MQTQALTLETKNSLATAAKTCCVKLLEVHSAVVANNRQGEVLLTGSCASKYQIQLKHLNLGKTKGDRKYK